MNLLQAVECAAALGNNYAKAYAKEALRYWNTMDDEEFRTQMLYIVANISHMRGEGSKEARKVIKSFVNNEVTHNE